MSVEKTAYKSPQSKRNHNSKHSFVPSDKSALRYSLSQIPLHSTWEAHPDVKTTLSEDLPKENEFLNPSLIILMGS